MLVDLERNRPVELLPDRTAETLVRWLRAHPGVDAVARDRSAEYARASLEGAPTALQVAERWHLLHNLRQVLEHFFHAVHGRLRHLVGVVHRRAQHFVLMLRERDAGALEPWLGSCAQSGIGGLASFAAGLRQDYGAVRAALTEPWSSGQAEAPSLRNRLRNLYS